MQILLNIRQWDCGNDALFNERSEWAFPEGGKDFRIFVVYNLNFTSAGILNLFFDPVQELRDKLAAMLNYNLAQLCGPKCRNLKVHTTSSRVSLLLSFVDPST